MGDNRFRALYDKACEESGCETVNDDAVKTATAINELDGDTPFDWGRASSDYARYRDIYPQEFFQKIADRGLCVSGQRVLDVGTGTGSLPRGMYAYGARWVGADASRKQITQARKLSKGMSIEYRSIPAEELDYPSESFDVITACQCFWYFDHKSTALLFHRLLKPGGRLLVLYMAWLPFEDEIAGASERLVLKYSPRWSGAGETVRPIDIPDCYLERFKLAHREEWHLDVPFTRDSWHGRMRACRGVGASLATDDLESWEKEHRALLLEIAPCRFSVKHYAAMAELVAQG